MVTTQSRSCFRYHNIYQYHLTEIFTEISVQMISAQRFPKTARVARLAITCLSHKGQKLRLFWSFDICGDIERASTRGHRARMQFPQNFDICGGIETLERASSHGHRVQMQFPQKFCPLCDKQVITSPLGNEGLISLVFSKFSQKFGKTLKIGVKLILNCPRAHSITYTNNSKNDIQFNAQAISYVTCELPPPNRISETDFVSRG